ncbi:putative phosphomutase (TIGR03848 family) [Actinoalloteichus hoggarensis]|uniref:Phosphoserine phosphatase 1 n=1 Tax=Actinoalloteichus hoggarensis TaxID=1470176 RepID=A0A221W4N1_9PSEU|nr:histidine phosphatase family protein [Actinoalloteichus hoggarensis]ASO20547.1 Phosphoserine phosphatase 1 [Actinoalloteichus hoggarensis]MBB5923587.1 putative phosphomutase (TIGR03848 family) [Actinoalloteichus hoggarensis]
MATVILLRHARSTANGAGVLAGRTPGVRLHEVGVAQATELVARLADVPLVDVVTSPLERCQDTLRPLLGDRDVEPTVDPRLAEVDYGAWTGRSLHDLAKEELWSVVQQHPSAAVFPEGEGLAQVQTRAVEAIREHDRRITETHGADAVWLACSHGDVIKAILADALCTHLDGFQRLVVDPASLSVVRYTSLRPFVIRVNDNNGDLSALLPAENADKKVVGETDAVVGGSTGP